MLFCAVVIDDHGVVKKTSVSGQFSEALDAMFLVKLLYIKT